MSKLYNHFLRKKLAFSQDFGTNICADISLLVVFFIISMYFI